MSPSAKGRGPGPRDLILFAEKHTSRLSQATRELSYLFARGYAEASALKLVGDHHQLQKRQRMAVLRSAADPAELEERKQRHATSLQGTTLDIDGFNLIILLEAALGGSLLLQGADGCFRDLCSLHGSYKLVEQTGATIRSVGEYLQTQQVAQVRWWLDSPVSNSGRLTGKIRQIGEENGWNWHAEATPHVDKIVSESNDIAVSSDKIILRRCQSWYNLGAHMIPRIAPNAWILPLPNTHIPDTGPPLWSHPPTP